MLSCSSGEKNTPSITDAVVSRPFAPSITAPTVAPSTNDLTWINQDTVLSITTGTPLSETHNAADSNASLVIYSLDLVASSCDEETWNPALSYDGASGVLSGRLLAASGSTCDLVLKANSGLEEIVKTVTYAITIQSPIAEITAITLSNPLTSPSSVTLPTLSVTTLSAGDTLSLYSDAACSSLVESLTVIGDPQDISLTSPLADGVYDFYAMASNATNSSLCSTASLNYVVDTNLPDPATNLSYAPVTASPASSSLMNWTASATAGVSYKVSLGSASGLDDIISQEDAGALTSYTVNALSLTECSAVYPTIHTFSSSGVQASDLIDTNSFYYDVTPPSDPSALSFSNYYLLGTGPTLNWSAASDNCAAPLSYMVALGASPGDDSLQAWTSVSSLSHAFSGLSLSVGDSVYMSVKAVDQAGLESNVVSASFIVPTAPNSPVLGASSIGIDRVVLGWSVPASNNRPITDYSVEYKESSSSTWNTFSDGISADQVMTISGLMDSTNYDFRIYADNGEQSSYSSTLTVTTQVNNPFFDPVTYKTMNVGGATSSKMVALENATTVTLADGVSTISLNKGDTHSFASTLGDIIESDKPVFIAGRLANDNSDVRKANIVWSSPDWAGREFIFSVSRYAPHQITAYMFEAGTMNIAEGTNPATSYTFAAGEFKSITITSNGNYFVTSDKSALLFLVSKNSGNDYQADPKPLLPASNDIIGFPSSSAVVTVDTDATSINRYLSDGSVSTLTGNMSSPINHPGTGVGTNRYYESYATRYTSTGGKIVAASLADGNGNCTAPFLPVSMMKKRFATNVNAEWVAFASDVPAVITISQPGAATSTLVLTRTGSDPKSPYYGRLSSQSEGTSYESSDRFAAWYEPSTDTDAGRRDETIMFGFD
jgi:hypothetical protein